MSEYAIEVTDLTKTYKLYESNKRRIIEGLFPFVKPQYRKFDALNNVNFKIKKGEIVKKVPESELLETLRQELLHWKD